MKEGMGTGDMIVAGVAVFGVIVLIVLFVFVVKTIILKKEEDQE